MFFNQIKNGFNQWWRYLLGFIIVLLAQLLGSMPFVVVMFNKGLVGVSDLSALDMNSNILLLLILFPFVLTFFVMIFISKNIHKRAFLTMITATKKIRWNRIFFAFGLWLLASMGMEAISYFSNPENYQWTFPGASFFVLLAIAIFILPLQTSAEELIFRGYFLQGLNLLFKNRLIAVIISGAIFGAIHFGNPEVADMGYSKAAVFYIGLGVFLGLLAVLDNGIEIPLGIHAANNMYAACLVTYPKAALPTKTILTSTVMNIDMMLYSFIGFSVLIFIIFQLKYKWTAEDYKRLISFGSPSTI